MERLKLNDGETPVTGKHGQQILVNSTAHRHRHATLRTTSANTGTDAKHMPFEKKSVNGCTLPTHEKTNMWMELLHDNHRRKYENSCELPRRLRRRSAITTNISSTRPTLACTHLPSRNSTSKTVPERAESNILPRLDWTPTRPTDCPRQRKQTPEILRIQRVITERNTLRRSWVWAQRPPITVETMKPTSKRTQKQTDLNY